MECPCTASAHRDAPTVGGARIQDLPPELRERIVSALLEDNLRDVAAAHAASPSLFGGTDFATHARRWGADRLYRLVRVGPPIETVVGAMDLRSRPLYRRLICAAARCGRVDLLRLVCERIEAAGIDGNDHVHDDDVRAGRRPGIACSTEDHVDWAINEAARHGHVGVVRWLTTRRILGVDRTDLFDEDESALAMAMYRMQPAVVMYIHDRMAGQGGFPQEYHDNTVRWMWRAPRPGIVRMVIEHAWAVVEPPKAEDIAYMIRERHHDMLLYALDRYPLPPVAVMEPRWRTELESAVAHAARSGHTDTVRLAIQRGLCASLGPVVAGAADGGRIDVLEWVTADEPELCMAAMPPLTVLDMRTAAAAATTAGSVAALEWLVKRFGADLVGPHHVHAAFHCGKLSVVRFLDSLLLAPTGAPFPWGDMVARALLSPLRLPVLRFLVEEKGARVEPHHIASVARPDPEVVRYVLSRFGPSVFQDAVSLMGARQLSSDAASIRHICGIVPGLCVSVAAAMGADERLSPYSSDDDDDDLITMCECAACVALVGVPAADALASCSRKRRCDDADRADRASDGSEDGRDRCDPLKRRRIDA